MQINLNQDEVKVAVKEYLKNNFSIDPKLSEITLNDAYAPAAAVWSTESEEE